MEEEKEEEAVLLSSRLTRGRRQQVDVRLTRRVLTWKDVKKTTKCAKVGFGHLSTTGKFKERLPSVATVVSFPALCPSKVSLPFVIQERQVGLYILVSHRTVHISEAHLRGAIEDKKIPEDRHCAGASCVPT